ncbi:predicted protein [Phaeodactylum tricornutum CCAP 1055/1]|uniref:Glycosyltransferase family 8 protein n=2 Tax=Phaeodactylum tricornutum TaxID=2850 RepID=B7G9R2_PHATC|nr:predicted protein [Phaeodactylum tricornutum CCAP 1055/1]EEC44602.1 predicted protein [Phaeodactylum tricornutum CCAP 1055/1]|eukprot:XP_002183933.1 predicted protein [Phaeodactylum tricornutum CCAP 1055/1]
MKATSVSTPNIHLWSSRHTVVSGTTGTDPSVPNQSGSASLPPRSAWVRTCLCARNLLMFAIVALHFSSFLFVLQSPADRDPESLVPDERNVRRRHQNQSVSIPVFIPTTSTPAAAATSWLATGSSQPRAPSSPYAYTFVIGAIHEDRPAYKGFIYDILVSFHSLQKLGSQADFWVLAQLAPDSNLTELPAEDMRALHTLGVRVKMLPQSESDSFAEFVYNKFLVFRMTEYRRVLFLDADLIPLANLDYLFHLSDQGEASLIRPNLIIATRGEPCNAGFFMVEPHEKAWQRLQGIVARHHEEAKTLPYPHFDWRNGWGHNFQKAGDEWRAVLRNGQAWRFHAGHSDQGLLYYFLKYAQQDVTLVIGERVENWVPGTVDGQPQMAANLTTPFNNYTTDEARAKKSSCLVQNTAYECVPPYRDFMHFSGSSKPWQGMLPRAFVLAHEGLDRWEKLPTPLWPSLLWFKELIEVNDLLQLGLDVENWNEQHLPRMKDSPMGYIAKFADHANHVHGASS